MMKYMFRQRLISVFTLCIFMTITFVNVNAFETELNGTVPAYYSNARDAALALSAVEDGIYDSANTMLTDITVNGNGVYGFESSKLNYTVDVPYTYTKNSFDVAMPVIEATANDAESDVDIDYPDTVNGGVATITVKSADGTQSAIYRLTLNPVGVNKYKNPGFEGSTDGWTATSVELTSEEKYAGNKSAKIKGTSTVQQSLFYQIVRNLTANRKYIASWAVKMSNNLGTGWTDKLLQPYRYEHNAYVTDGVYLMDGSKSEDQYFNASSDVGNGWRRNMVVFPNDYEHNMSLFTYSSYAQSAYTLWIDDAYMSELIVADVDVTSSESWVEIPQSGSTTVQLTAKLKNQFGNSAGLENVKDISWRVVGAPAGVSIDEDGLLTITSEASVDAIKVDAFVDLGGNFVQNGATGRINIGIGSEDAVKLTDIEVGGRGIYGFTPSTENYTIDLPYNYNINNFDNFSIPEVKVTTAVPTSKVSIDYPEKADGGVITITVTSADNALSKKYRLTLRPIGMNLYKDGGFESDFQNQWGGYLVHFSPDNTEKFGGNKSLLVSHIDHGSYAYHNDIPVYPDKTYIGSWAIKNSPDNSSFYSPTEYNGAENYYEDHLWQRYTVDGKRSGFMSDIGDGWKKSLFVFKMDESKFNGNPSLDSKFTYVNWSANSSFYLDEAYLSELIVSRAKIRASKSEITIPQSGTKTITLTADILNQFGNSAGLENEKVKEWKILGNPQGVSINSKTGVITVNPDANIGTITVEAMIDPAVNTEQEILLERCDIELLPSVEDNLKLADVEFDGRGIYGFNGDKNNYTVDVPYRYTDGDADFSMPTVTARAVDDNSKVKVEYPQTVYGGIIAITVTSSDNSLSNVYNLTLNPIGKTSNDEDLSKIIVSDVRVTPKSDTVVIPSVGTEEVRLTTEILNQFGNTKGLGFEKVRNYRILGEPIGVTVNSEGIVSIASDAKEGTIIVEAEVEPWISDVQQGITGRAEISLTKKNLYEVCFSDSFEEETTGEKPSKWDEERFGVADFTVEAENLPNGEINKFARLKTKSSATLRKGAVVATGDGQVEIPLWDNDKNIVIEAKMRSDGFKFAKSLRVGYPKDTSYEDYGGTKYSLMEMFRTDRHCGFVNGAFYQGTAKEQTKIEANDAFALAEDKWYDVKITIYPKSKTVEFYLDGELLTIDGRPQGYFTSVDFLSMETITNLTFTCADPTRAGLVETLDFDDVKVYCVSDMLATKVLSKNSSFDDFAQNGYKANWKNGLSIVSDESNTGEYCAYISGRTQDTDTFTQEITLMPDKTYIASAYVKTLGSSDYFTLCADGDIDKPFAETEENISVDEEWQNVCMTISTAGNLTNTKIYPTVLPESLETDFYVDDFYVGELCIEKGEIAGDDMIFLPVSGNTTREYSVKLFNQFGNEAGLYDEEPYKWEIVGDSRGTSITTEGLLVVPATADEGEITIKAYLNPSYIGADSGEMTFTYDVKLVRCDAEITFKKGDRKLFGIENGSITADVVIHNGQTPKNISVYTALYEKSGDTYTLKEATRQISISAKNEESIIYTTNPINVTDADKQIVKVFVWDENLCPIASCELLDTTGITNVFYVSPDGCDDNAGTIEAPFATLEAARDAIRAMKSTYGLPDGGATVYIRGGKYFRSAPFDLTSEDSGTESSPIKYVAYPGEEPVFVGGIQLTTDTFTGISDGSVKNRIIDVFARDSIIEVDLSKYGLDSIDEVNYIGNYILPWIEKKLPAPELSVGGTAMHLARYPNNDFLTIDNIVHQGSKEPWTGNEEEYQNDGFEITYYDERIDKWKNAEDIRLFGYWHYYWADQSVLVKNIDSENNTIKSAMPGYLGIRSGQKYYAYNLIEELDAPGEYYIDRISKKLYFYPPENYMGDDVYLSIFDGNMVNITKASHITIDGLYLTACRGSAFSTNSANAIEIINCEIDNTGAEAINLSGYNNIVENCYIHDVNGGIIVTGGERLGLIPGNNIIHNNEIERFDRLKKTYNAAVYLIGVGNRVSHNCIHDADHLAIMFAGNDHVIEYNEIYDVCRLGEDSAVIYTGGTWCARGNEIVYNYIHDIDSQNSDGVGIFAIYLDDQFSGTTISGNVFENIDEKGESSAVYINGGKDNKIYNNIFVNCKEVSFNTGDTMDFTDTDRFVEQLNKYHYKDEPYKTKYPELYTLLDNPEYYKPMGNEVRNNLYYNTKSGKVLEYYDGLMEFSNNIRYADGEDPGFASVADRNYNLIPDADIFTKNPGFRSIPFNIIGNK